MLLALLHLLGSTSRIDNANPSWSFPSSSTRILIGVQQPAMWTADPRPRLRGVHRRPAAPPGAGPRVTWIAFFDNQRPGQPAQQPAHCRGSPNSGRRRPKDSTCRRGGATPPARDPRRDGTGADQQQGVGHGGQPERRRGVRQAEPGDGAAGRIRTKFTRTWRTCSGTIQDITPWIFGHPQIEGGGLIVETTVRS